MYQHTSMNFKEEVIESSSSSVVSELSAKISNNQELTESDKQLMVAITNMLHTRRTSKNVAFMFWVTAISTVSALVALLAEMN